MPPRSPVQHTVPVSSSRPYQAAVARHQLCTHLVNSRRPAEQWTGGHARTVLGGGD